MRYFVTITDENGRQVQMEVSAAIFDVFDDERKLDERHRNEKRRHLDKRGLEDYIISHEQSMTAKSAEEVYMDREALAEVLDTCTPTQRRRFCLNKIYGYSCAEIARLEDCTKYAVAKSIETVVHKLDAKK